MAFNVWISILSEYGLNMGEIGKLAEGTDPNIIAPALKAFKDIVTTEATSSDSNFLKGSTEISANGVYNVSLNGGGVIYLAYIIGTEKGRIIPDDYVNRIEDLIVNLAKQLTQFGDINELAMDGAPLPKMILIKALLNASTTINMENKIVNKPRELIESYKKTIKKIFENNELLLELIEDTIGYDWQEDNNVWSYEGILKEKYQRELVYQLAILVLFEVANSKPDIFIYSPEPRLELQNVMTELIPILNSIKNPNNELLKIIDNINEDIIDNFISKIPITELHISKKLVEQHFVRNSIIQLTLQKPIILFNPIDPEPLIKQVNKKYKPLKHANAGLILFEAIKDDIDTGSHGFVKSFYSGFIKGMRGIQLTQTAMDLIVAFTQELVSDVNISKKVTSLKTINKLWKNQLSKFIKSKSIEKLTVEAIEEAGLLLNAVGNAIASTLTEIIQNQFYLTTDFIGSSITDYINFYQEIGKIIKIIDILSRYLNLIGKINYDTNLIIPNYQHLLLAYLNSKNYTININGKDYQLKNDKFIFENKSYFTSQLLSRKEKFFINISGEKVPIDINNISYDEFVKYFVDSDILLNGIIYAFKQNIYEFILPSISEWLKITRTNFEKIESYFENYGTINPKIIKDINIELPNYSDLITIQFGHEIETILRKYFDMITDASYDFNNEWNEIIEEINNKGNIDKKMTKKCKSFINKYKKLVSKVIDELNNSMDNFVKSTVNDIKKHKKDIINIINPPEGDVVKLIKNDTYHVTPIDLVIKKLLTYITEIDGVQKDDPEQLKLSVSLTLFNNPPDSVYSPAYNELIKGKKSKTVKKALNKVKTREEFEKNLKKQGESYANKLFNDITNIFNFLEKEYIGRNGVVSSSNGKFYLHFNKLPIYKFTDLNKIRKLLKYKEVEIQREKDEWIISVDVTYNSHFESEDPSVVTLADTIRYLTRKSFDKRVYKTFKGLAKVASMLEYGADEKIMVNYKELKNTIFNKDKL